MTKNPAPDWDPRDASVLADQRRAYDELRERCPVAYDDFLGWSLFRHQDIVNVLDDPQTYSSASMYRAVPNGMDGLEHARYRRILEPYFRAGVMAALEPRCRRIAVDLMDVLLASDEVDLISAFARPFAFKTLCTFVGWSSETWEGLRDWTQRNQEAAFAPDSESGAALAREFAGYVAEEIRVRREAGGGAGDDIITSLMGTALDGVALSDEDIVSLLRNWTASHGTVTAGLGILIFYLAEHGDIQQQLRREPVLLDGAIEEILRADGMLVANRRTTTRAVEIEGRRIDAGEALSLNWISANRDSRAFDDPEAVRFDREPRGNLLFGAGVHQCLGVPLARLEMRVATEELLAHTTTIEFAATELPRRDVYPSNGFQAMPVRLR